VQKYTVSSGPSTLTPLYVEVQVYNPLTDVGVANVPVTVVIKNGATTITRNVTTRADGTAVLCGVDQFPISTSIIVGYASVSFGGTTLPANSSVPVSVSQGVPSFC
jgi:hypothetical protein